MPRQQERVEVSLEGRQIAGAVAGALVTLALVFALGVGFGRQLALAPAPNAPHADLDARPAAPPVQDTGFTFHEALVKGDQTVVRAAPPPVPTPAPAPVAPVPVPAMAEKPADPVPAVAAPAPEAPKAEVKPEPAPAPEEKPNEPPPAPKADERKNEPATWCVQFGASPARAEADKLAATLLDFGYTSYVVVADLPGKGRFYRVRVGHFATKDQADKLRADASTKHKLAGMVMPAR